MEPTFPESWYKDGLNFQCTGCGKCCTGFPGYVWVNDEEIKNLSAFLGISPSEFQKKFTRFVNQRYALIEQAEKNYDCIFLDGKKCTVYEARPVQCRTFPWWKQNLLSQETWKNASKDCEGIRDDAPLVSYEEIQKQMTANEKKFKNNNI